MEGFKVTTGLSLEIGIRCTGTGGLARTIIISDIMIIERIESIVVTINTYTMEGIYTYILDVRATE